MKMQLEVPVSAGFATVTLTEGSTFSNLSNLGNLSSNLDKYCVLLHLFA